MLYKMHFQMCLQIWHILVIKLVLSEMNVGFPQGEEKLNCLGMKNNNTVPFRLSAGTVRPK